MITNFFIPKLNNHDVQELWFQQDDATCHKARASIDLLKDTFGDRQISRFGPVNWPPRSCDLTPLDYFLWGYVKSLVNADKPRTLGHLEDNIRRVNADIWPQMLEKVIENWTSRLDCIRASRGNPMPEIIFKIGEERRRGDLGQRVRFPTGGFSGRRKREKSPEICRGPAFKADHITWKRIRYGFITIKSTTLIGLRCPRKNTTLPAIRFVETRRTHIPV
ncbi:transposable element Tc3 transposase [Trichonephila clavipes]|nr:transposable element Tc3 transposase [Trichonephila clavipes]